MQKDSKEKAGALEEYSKLCDMKAMPVLFYSHTSGEFACFSNFYRSRLVDDKGTAFCCTEQWLMWNKAVVFNDAERARLIMETTDPAEIKALGRLVVGFDEAVWARHREDVMVRGLLLKFRQNPALRAKLLSTGVRPIAEASPRDAIFGIGADETSPQAQNPANWSAMGQSLFHTHTRTPFQQQQRSPAWLMHDCDRRSWPRVDEVPLRNQRRPRRPLSNQPALPPRSCTNART